MDQLKPRKIFLFRGFMFLGCKLKNVYTLLCQWNINQYKIFGSIFEIQRSILVGRRRIRHELLIVH